MKLELRGDVSIAWCISALAMIAIVVVTIVGNCAVITALRHTTPRFPAHYPLASLAMADFMLGLFVLPISAARELFLFQPYPYICSFWSTMDVFCCTASILSLCTLGWERWCGITAPLSRARRHKMAKLFAMLVWPFAAMVALPTAFIPTHMHYLPNEIVKACTVNTNIGYVFYSVTFSFYLPATGMMFVYTKIILALAKSPGLRAHRGKAHNKTNMDHNQNENPVSPRQSTPNCRNRENTNKSETITKDLQKSQGGGANMDFVSPKGNHLAPPLEKQEAAPSPIPSPLKESASPAGLIPRQRRATQTIVILMSIFLICWWPFFIMLPIDSLCECVSDTTWLVCTWLGYVNSALDPLVYAASSPSVRQALQSTLTLSSRSNTVVELPVRRRIHF